MSNRPPSRAHRQTGVTFDRLLVFIQQAHQHFVAQATQAINVSLTLRNWIIGYHIENYERAGADRAQYGDHLMDELAVALRKQGLARCDRRELYRYRQFYLTYPQIVEAVTPPLPPVPLPATTTMAATAGAPAPGFWPTGKMLVEKLSFTHLAELIQIDNPRKRAFYESECLRGNWSVRKLKHQIASLYYELSGLAKDRPPAAKRAPAGADATEPHLTLRDPYVFEFLGLKPREVIGKSDLEDQLLDQLQEFLLELGYGLCFEARQKYILIGDTHCFVDLVFYHRILKCHVLVEFKPAEFGHENIAQLDTCVTWYRRTMMAEGDNPPVGILLCAHPHQARVEYASAGMDNRLFVSRYQPALPNDQEMRRFLEQALALPGSA